MPGVPLCGDFLSAQSEIYRKFVFRLMVFFCFQMNCIFFAIFRAVLCFPRIYLSPWSRLVSITSCCGASTNSMKAGKKNIVTPENATNFSHTQRLMCKELFFLNTSHQWWLWRFCGQARCRYRNPGFHALSLAPALS